MLSNKAGFKQRLMEFMWHCRGGIQKQATLLRFIFIFYFYVKTVYFPPLFLYSTVAHCTVLVCHIKSRKRAHEVWDSDKSCFVFF